MYVIYIHAKQLAKQNLIQLLYSFLCYTKKFPVLFKGSRKHQKPKPRPSDVTVPKENRMQGEDVTSKPLLKDQLYFK